MNLDQLKNLVNTTSIEVGSVVVFEEVKYVVTNNDFFDLANLPIICFDGPKKFALGPEYNELTKTYSLEYWEDYYYPTFNHEFFTNSISVNFKTAGRKLKKDVNAVNSILKNLSGSDASKYIEEVKSVGFITVLGYTLIEEDLIMKSETTDCGPFKAMYSDGIGVILDTKITDELYSDYLSSAVGALIMAERKANFGPTDIVKIEVRTKEQIVFKMFKQYATEIMERCNSTFISVSDELMDSDTKQTVDDVEFSLSVSKTAWVGLKTLILTVKNETTSIII